MNPNIVSNLRVLEDGLFSLILLVVIIRLGIGFVRLRAVPYRAIPLSVGLGLVPFLGWKLMGAFRRIALVGDTAFATTLHDIGEALEAFSGLALAVGFLVTFLLMRKFKY